MNTPEPMSLIYTSCAQEIFNAYFEAPSSSAGREGAFYFAFSSLQGINKPRSIESLHCPKILFVREYLSQLQVEPLNMQGKNQVSFIPPSSP